MSTTAPQTLDRLESAVLPLAYPYRYAGGSGADPHLTGQPCRLLAHADRVTEPTHYLVGFACGCREVLPCWTLTAAHVQ